MVKAIETNVLKKLIPKLEFHQNSFLLAVEDENSKSITRWTFFRVKLVFECDFEISWSLGPLDLGTLGPLPSSNTSSYLLSHPPFTSSYLFLLLSFFSMVWYGEGGRGVLLSFDIGDGPLTFM